MSAGQKCDIYTGFLECLPYNKNPHGNFRKISMEFLVSFNGNPAENSVELWKIHIKNVHGKSWKNLWKIYTLVFSTLNPLCENSLTFPVEYPRNNPMKKITIEQFLI